MATDMDDATGSSGLDDEFLRWEYTLAARSDVLWTAAGLPLVRAADDLWKRAEAARVLWAELFADFEIPDHESSRRLSAAELQILDDQGLARVALMLLGLAIENVSKTLIIRADPSTVGDDARLQLKTHDLVHLLARAQIAVSDDETRQLGVVRDYLEWLGRYPVPLAAVGKRRPRSLDGAWVARRLGDVRVTWESARAVLQRAIDKRDYLMFKAPAI